MGYDTSFSGCFTLDKPLKPEHKAYLEAFSQTRRMKRRAAKTEKMSDPKRKAVGLPAGKEGGYFVGSDENTPDIADYNCPPEGQPGLWCQWIPGADGTGIEWDGGEKFHDYKEWLEYLIANFLGPWGYVLSGEVKWEGEDSGDNGVLKVKDNKVKAVHLKLVEEEDEEDEEPAVEPDPAPNPIDSLLDLMEEV